MGFFKRRNSNEPCRCVGCGAVKPLSEFAFRKNGELSRFCGTCYPGLVEAAKRNASFRRSLGSGTTIASRDNYLAFLGFASWKEYLVSSERRSALDRAFGDKGRKCSCCGTHAETIRYSRYLDCDLNGSSSHALWPVCEPCFRRCECPSGDFLDPLQANARFALFRGKFR